MKKFLALILALLMLSGCSGNYSKYFSEPVDFDYLNGGKEIENMEIVFENGDSVLVYENTELSFSEKRFLTGILKEYEFEYVVPGKKDEEKGELKYSFRNPEYDEILPGKKVFYLGLGENAVTAGIDNIKVYENAVYISVNTESCENPEDFSAEEFNFGPNYHYFVSGDKELIERLDSVYEKLCQRAILNIKDLSEEEFYAHAKELWGYSEEQIELCLEAGVPKIRILRPFMGDTLGEYVDSTEDAKYSVGLFAFGSEYKLENEGFRSSDTLFLPTVTNVETGKMTFIPETERREEDYSLGLIDDEKIFFCSENSVKIYDVENPSEVLGEAEFENKENTMVLSAFSPKGTEKIYVFNIKNYSFFNDTFGDYRDYSKYYEIDVFEKDGSFIKTIKTGIPLETYWEGKNGLAVPKEYGGITAGKESTLHFQIEWEGYSFDFETEEMKNVLPKNVKLSAKKGESGKYYLEKEGKAITDEIYDSITIRREDYYENEEQKTEYYAVCAFADGTEMRLFRNEENHRKPIYTESANVRFDIFLSDGTLINEKPVQNFYFYIYGDGMAWEGDSNTVNLYGYSDNCYYRYVKPTGGTEFKLTVEKAEDKVNEYGFTITEKYYPGFYGKKDKIYGVKNPFGKVIAETLYLNVEMPFEDRIILWTGDDYDYTGGEIGYPVIIDTEGKVLSDEFDYLYYEFTGDGRYIGIAYAMVWKEDGNWTRDYWIIDKDGNKLFEIKGGDTKYLYLEVDFESGKLIGSDDDENHYEYEIEEYLMKS